VRVRVRICLQIAVFAGFVALCPVTSSAARLGHPGVSTRGATSAATQWNLICDPQYVDHGSITTAYTSVTASLFEVKGLDPYSVSQVLVQVQAAGKSSFVTFTPDAFGLVTINSSAFPQGATETGIAQVFWGITGTPPLPAPDDNTHMLIFNNATANPSAIASFTDYLDAGSAHGGQTPTSDFYTGFYPDATSTPFTYSADPTSTNFAPSVDTETVIEAVGTPEPSSVALVAIVSTLGLLKRRRQEPLQV
jgi:hypothetical protein